MRVMVVVKANKDSEAGILPSPELLAKMGKYNEELHKAGILLAAEGLRSSAKGKRVKFGDGKRIVTDGPFAETKELIAGFWLWKVKSMDEAVEWLKRAPFDGGVEVEIRQLHEMEDFAPGEAIDRERKLAKELTYKTR
ncbi:MAG: dehydrogenase [Acidobacteria bacterium]|nr:MAG: dehydrogenase [Acidobacteriota bacterium]